MNRTHTTCQALAKITITWSPALVEEVCKILREHRTAARAENVGTPEMMRLAIWDERALENAAIVKIARAFARTQGPLIDCDVIGAIEKLREAMRANAD